MMRRIAVGGFLHESHSFAPRPTTYADFVQPGGLPPFCAGTDSLAAMRTHSVALSGALAVAEAAGVDLVPLAWGFANPAGPVQDEALERISARICAPLSMALDEGPLTAFTSICMARLWSTASRTPRVNCCAAFAPSWRRCSTDNQP
jgi:microcystin degradation protein MlrC